MGIVRKQGILTTIIAYVGIALGMFIVLYFLPKHFSPEEVGIRNLIFDVALVLAQLFALGTGSAFIKFYPTIKEKEKKRNSLLLFCLGFPIITLFILLLLYFSPFDLVKTVFHENAAAIIPYFKYCVILGFIMTYTFLFEYYARLNNSFILAKANREISFRVFSILLIVLYGVDFINFNQFWVAALSFYILIFTINVIHVNSLESLTLKIDPNFFKLESIKPIVNFSLFAVLTGGTSLLILKFDSVMVASMIGLESTAIYTTAIFITTVIETPRKSLAQVIGPLLSTSFAKNDFDTIDAIYKKTSVNQVIIGGAIFSLIWLNIDYLFILMPKGEIFSAGKFVVLILGLTKMVDMISSCNTAIIAYSKTYRFNLYAIIFLLLITVTLNYILIPIYQIEGAALATLISISSFNLVQTTFVYTSLKLNPFHKKLILPSMTFGVLLLLSYINIKLTNPFLGIILNSSIVSIVYLALIMLTDSADDLKDLIKKTLTRFF